MFDLGKCYSRGEIHVSYDHGIKGSLLIRTKDGINPIELNQNELFMFNSYPYILNELINGNKLYIQGFNGYVGKEQREGPYSEERYFQVRYFSTDTEFYELLRGLEKNIKNHNGCKKRIYK